MHCYASVPTPGSRTSWSSVWTRESWAPKPCGLGLETRRLHALAREKAVDPVAMNTEDAADAHRIEPAAVDQPPDGFGVHASQSLSGLPLTRREVIGARAQRDILPRLFLLPRLFPECT